MPDATAMTVTPDGSGGLSISYAPSRVVGGGNGCICYNWSPSTQLPNWNAALAAVTANIPGARAKIVTFGGSTVQGTIAFDPSPEGKAFPNQMAIAMTAYGMPAQYANFVGGQEEYNKIVVNTAGVSYNDGYRGPGQGAWFLDKAGDNIVWTPETTGRLNGHVFNHIDIIIEGWSPATPPLSITCVGLKGPQTVIVKPLDGAGTQIVTGSLTPDTFSSVTIMQPTTTPQDNIIRGVSFWNSKAPAIEVINCGIGGSQSAIVNEILPGSVRLVPNLALVEYLLNDMLYNDVTLDSCMANITQFITDLRAAKCDVILLIPHPFILSGDPQLYTMDQLIVAIHALAVKYDVGVIDLNSTYGDNPNAYGASFISQGVHPNAPGYQDMGERIAATLTNTAQTFPLSAAYSAAYPPNTNNGVLD